MKWIGQHIWDFISRFRSKVYLEDVDNAGSDTDAFLVKKADGEVAIRTGTQVLSDIGGVSSGFLVDNASDTTTGTLTANGGFDVGTTQIRADSIQMTPSTDDTVRFTANTNGTLDIVTVDTAGIAAHINLIADGDLFITQRGIKFQATPPICFNTRTIKVMPNEFFNYDEDGGASVVEDDGPFGVRTTAMATDLHCWVKIPALFQVTHVQFHTSDNFAGCAAAPYNYQTGVVGSGDGVSHTFTSNTNYQLKNAAGTATPMLWGNTKDLMLSWNPLSSSRVLYGATVTIENAGV